MIQIYIASQIGTGTRQDPFRSPLGDLWAWGNRPDGDFYDEIDYPSRRFSVCVVHAVQACHDAIAADGRAKPILPNVTADNQIGAVLDTLISDIDATRRAQIQADIESFGVSTAWITGTNSIRDVLRYAYRSAFFSQLSEGEGNTNLFNFLKTNLDSTVGSLTPSQRQAGRDWITSKGLDSSWITNQTTIRQVIHYVVTNLGWGIIRFSGQNY